MSKLHQRIEQIFRFRLLSNSDIPEYLKRMGRMGKIDAVRQAELFNLILTKLGEIEDKEEVLPKSGDLYLMPDVPERREGTLTPSEMPPTAPVAPVDASLDETQEFTHPCPDCDFVAKSKLGLHSHSRKHKKQV